jgi:hypothetical protein
MLTSVYTLLTSTMSPSIHLSLRAPGVQIQAFLNPECLGDLIALVQKHRTAEAVHGDLSPGPRDIGRGMLSGARLHRDRSHDFAATAPLSDAAVLVKRRLGAISQSDLPNHLARITFGDKLLILIGWLEVRSPLPVKKGALRDLFARLGEPAPANPGRDIKNLLIDGLLLRSSDREGFQLTDQGWQRVGGLLPPPRDGEAGATPVLA